MRQGIAQEIASAWLDETKHDPDIDWRPRAAALAELVRDVLPDLDPWACYLPQAPKREPFSAPTCLGIVGIADGTIYKVEGQDNSAGGWAGFNVVRHDAADLQVSLIENLSREPGLPPIRRRGWVFAPQPGDLFGLTSEETLEGPNVVVPAGERVARAIAHAAGWAGVSAPSTPRF